MNDNGNIKCTQVIKSLFKAGKRVASPDQAGSTFMDGLKPQFYPDEFVRKFFFPPITQKPAGKLQAFVLVS